MGSTDTATAHSAAHPATAEHMTAALNAALDAGDLNLITGILGEMTRTHRMRRVAQETGLGRESLYKSMRAGASPEFNTVLKMLRSLGFRLQVHPVAKPGQEDSSPTPRVPLTELSPRATRRTRVESAKYRSASS